LWFLLFLWIVLSEILNDLSKEKPFINKGSSKVKKILFSPGKTQKEKEHKEERRY